MFANYQAELHLEHDSHVQFRQNSLATRFGLESEKITQNYLRRLSLILAEVKIPDSLQLISKLITQNKYFKCFDNSVFNVKGNQLTVTTQVYTFTLQQTVLLTCTVVDGNQVSV